LAINRGALWVATNLDPTVPSALGRLPGNGSMVAALRHATGAEPVSTGKPDPTMHRESVERSKAERPIVVGDRLDTDIEGANAVGCASLLVFSGVTTPAELLSAREELRPTYLAEDVGGLLQPHPGTEFTDGSYRCGNWSVEVCDATSEGGSDRPDNARVGSGSSAAGLTLRLSAAVAIGATATEEPGGRAAVLDALRALCVAAWASTGSAAGSVTCIGSSDAARAALSALELA
jgi:hypothetical protein